MTTTPNSDQNPDGRTVGPYDGRLAAAVRELLARRDGGSHTPGNFTTHRITSSGWMPDPAERRACCPRTRLRVEGTRSHLRGAVHVANLYAVDVEDLRAAVRATHRTTGESLASDVPQQ